MAKMFMNHQFCRPLSIQRVICVKRHENSKEPQSFPDSFYSLCTAGADLHREGTKKERAEVLGTELIPQVVILHSAAAVQEPGNRVMVRHSSLCPCSPDSTPGCALQ